MLRPTSAWRVEHLVVKIAQLCNLNCPYCYMYNHADQHFRTRPKFMSESTFVALVDNIRRYCDLNRSKMSIVFHGGEPMLFDPDLLDSWLIRAEEKVGDCISYGIQTNGTLVSSRWIEVIKRHSIKVGLSIDGPQSVHDISRPTHAGDGSYASMIKGLSALIEAGIRPGALCVIDPRRDGVAIYTHLRSLGFHRMDFLLPDISHDAKRLHYAGLAPAPIADYLIPVFDMWFEEDDPDIQIRLFTEAIRVLHGARSRTDMLQTSASNYMIIDSDGSLLVNDALKVCFPGAAESGLNVSTNVFEDLPALPNSVLRMLLDESIRLPTACIGCREELTCGGGAVPQRYSTAKGFDNPTVWCQDMIKFFAHIRTRIGMLDRNPLGGGSVEIRMPMRTPGSVHEAIQ